MTMAEAIWNAWNGACQRPSAGPSRRAAARLPDVADGRPRARHRADHPRSPVSLSRRGIRRQRRQHLLAPNPDRLRDYQERLRAMEARQALEAKRRAAGGSCRAAFRRASQPRAGGSDRGRSQASRVRESVREQRRAQSTARGRATGSRSAGGAARGCGRQRDISNPRLTRLRGGAPRHRRERALERCVRRLPRPSAAPAQHRPAPATGDRQERTPDRTDPISAAGPLHTLLEGTVIDAVLTNRLDGSGTAPVNCLVTNPVYSHSGQHVLIPAGARILGETRPVQALGETRLAVGFHRLLMPDGSTLRLDQFLGTQSDRRRGPARQGQPALLVHVRVGRGGRSDQRPGAVDWHRGLCRRNGRPDRHHRGRRRRGIAGKPSGHESVPEPPADRHDSRRSPREGVRDERPAAARLCGGTWNGSVLSRRGGQHDSTHRTRRGAAGLSATSVSAQFAVIDPANLAQAISSSSARSVTSRSSGRSTERSFGWRRVLGGWTGTGHRRSR